jgi:hypothetical protein
MNIEGGAARLVLLCPAWKKWGTAKMVKPGTVILHSRADDVIPFADSEELAKNSGAALIEVGTDHRLAECPSAANTSLTPASGGSSPWRSDMLKPAKNTICLWYNGDAEDAARFYAKRPFPIRPSAQCTAHRETFRLGRKATF